MGLVTVGIDFSDLDILLDVEGVIDKAAKDAAKNLAGMTFVHISEQAEKRLHTRRKLYIDGLSIAEDGDDIVINLDASVNWIESGMEPHSMLEDLLASPKAKTSKDGTKYIVVPFQHNKPAQEQTPAQRTLLDTIKKSLKDVGATPNGIEMTPGGEPRLGLVRSMNIMEVPLKTMEGPGMGHGPIGDVRQGPTGIPFLQGVNVYQNKVKGKDGEDKIQRTVMTFRVASQKMVDEGERWEHPGLDAMNFFEDAERWAKDQLANVIGPSITQQILVLLGG